MNKKILLGIAIAVIASAVVIGLKGTLGDKAVELPSEDKVENTLNIQEKNTSSSPSTQPNTPSTSEAKESGP